MSPLDAALLLVVGLSVLASVLRGLLRGVLIAAVLLLVLGLSPLGKGHLWQQSKVVSALSHLASSWRSASHKQAPTEQFIRTEPRPSERSRLGHATVKGDNGAVEQLPRQNSPDDGARWPQPLPEPDPKK